MIKLVSKIKMITVFIGAYGFSIENGVDIERNIKGFKKIN
jgi:hypothetical protein